MILQSTQKEDGGVCVVFATMVLGMGVNFVTLNTIYHYGAPRSIDDFCQESVISTPRDREVAAVWRYLQNDKE